VTAVSAKLKALVALGRRIGKVPWCADIGLRNAARMVLRLHGITRWESRREALERTRVREEQATEMGP
jgi:hypothetical protein